MSKDDQLQEILPRVVTVSIPRRRTRKIFQSHSKLFSIRRRRKRRQRSSLLVGRGNSFNSLPHYKYKYKYKLFIFQSMKHTVSVLYDRINRIMTAVTYTGGRTNSQGCVRLHQENLKKWMIRRTDTWSNGCLGKIDDHLVHTTTLPKWKFFQNLSSNHPCC